MKAWLIEDFTGVEKAKLLDVLDPKPGRGEVLLRVKFAALNPADAYLAKKEYPANPPLPHILGRDGLAEVVSCGPEVKCSHVGQKKIILRGDTGVNRWGTFAQLVVVKEEDLVDPPPSWSDEQAASATLVYLTAYQAITQWDDLPDNAVVLISGASGGVGIAAEQLSRAMGFTVIGLSRSAEKREKLLSLGFDHALDSTNPAWPKLLKEFLKDRRVDLAIDNIGGELFPQLLATLGDHGRISVVGRLAGPVPNFNTASLFFRRLKIGGVAVGSYGPSAGRTAWNDIVAQLQSISAHPIIDRVFDFEQLPAAFAHLETGPLGKVVLRVG